MEKPKIESKKKKESYSTENGKLDINKNHPHLYTYFFVIIHNRDHFHRKAEWKQKRREEFRLNFMFLDKY